MFIGKDLWLRALKGSCRFMAMTGMIRVEEMSEGLFIAGRVRKSGMRFCLPLMCWTVKSYLENQVLRLSNCLSGSNLFLKSKIRGKEELSMWIRNLWLIR